MTCYAQHYLPKDVTTTCCKASTADLVIDIREVKASVIRGTVSCENDKSLINTWPLIVATNISTNEVFYAIANANGTYEILVTPGNYEVAAFPNCDWYNSESKPCNSCSNC